MKIGAVDCILVKEMDGFLVSFSALGKFFLVPCVAFWCGLVVVIFYFKDSFGKKGIL